MPDLKDFQEDFAKMPPHLQQRVLEFVNTQKEHYTTLDVSKLLNISEWATRRLLRQGLIKGARPCGVWLIPHTEFCTIKADPGIIRKRRKLAELEKLDDGRP